MTATPSNPKGSAKRVAALRFESLNAFVDRTMRELTPCEVCVWMILYRDTRNNAAKTSMRDMAARAGRSVRAVESAVASLQAKGLVKVIQRGAMRRGASIYRVRPFVPDGGLQ
jgi:predicted transcriptional regulator